MIQRSRDVRPRIRKPTYEMSFDPFSSTPRPAPEVTHPTSNEAVALPW